MNFPNYTIERKLGEGGMADVFLARHEKLQKQVAIKVLKNEYRYNENIRKRFLSEARTLFEMSHPNIIKVTDLTDHDNVAAFVMEYIDGITLKEYIERNAPLRPEDILSVFTQILQGVGYAHEHGLVHRDIKPSNFMIDGKNRVRLLDFGISKVMNSTDEDHNLTGTQDRMGTPIYMSPEQVKSSKVVTNKSDIYSLGVVLWQMVTGKRPYDSATLSTFDIQTKIVNEPLESTGSSFDGIIFRATAKDPSARYPDCASFLQALSGSTTESYSSVHASAGAGARQTKDSTLIDQTSSSHSPETTQVEGTSPASTKTTQQPKAPLPKSWLLESILVTLFCCLPFGIAGIVNASKVESMYHAGRMQESQQASLNAAKWTRVAFFVGIVYYFFVIIFVAANS